MGAIARVRNLRGSARKARLVLDLIRGKSVPEAQQILGFSKKRVANATVKEGKADIDGLIVSKVYADDGPIMKRYRSRAHGRATVIRRRTCHITLEINGKE